LPRLLQLVEAGQFQSDLTMAHLAAYADTEAWPHPERQQLLVAFTEQVPALPTL